MTGGEEVSWSARDHVTAQYLRAALTGGSPLSTALRRASLPPAFLKVYGDRLLSRPLFAPESEIQYLADDLSRLFDLLVSLPQRLFDGDMARYCAALGLHGRRAAMHCRGATAQPRLHGRVDAYRDETSFKVLEMNLSANLGGMELAETNRAYLELDEFREFATEHRLSYLRTGEMIAAAVRRAAEPVSSGREPVVALLEAPGALQLYKSNLRSVQELLGQYALDVRLGEFDQVSQRGGRLWLDGAPIDVVFRGFAADQIHHHPGGDQLVEPILRAHEQRSVVLFTTLYDSMFGNKRNLALLSEARWRGAFTPEEAALIDRRVPWTRSLRGDLLGIGDEEVDLIDYCREHRQRLVIKPSVGFSGWGAVAGWTASDAEWNTALTACAAEDYIVQQRVVSRTEPVHDPETGLVEDWAVNWGVFLTDQGYSGMYIRTLRPSDGGIIGHYVNRLSCATGAFTYPDPDRR